ncbi:hypothetical protein NPIL_192241 [Nephila pilipes]|uniref:Uncharacterized protein n=1 Tax=Nephila pilipes TaxID=299642 RepID=A0A8X6UR13_NEPPI|nr:hypothetical protein NPIL_192241 [Nephila pilipes]
MSIETNPTKIFPSSFLDIYFLISSRNESRAHPFISMARGDRNNIREKVCFAVKPPSQGASVIVVGGVRTLYEYLSWFEWMMGFCGGCFFGGDARIKDTRKGW